MVSASFLTAPIPSFSPCHNLATAAYRSGLTARHRQGIYINCRSCKSSCNICALKSRWQEAAAQKKRASLPCKAIATASTSHEWDRTTSRCVELSTVAFMVLLMPQVIKNYISMTTGHAEALAVLSWVGYLTSLFGNVLLLGCFVDKQEGGATAVQAIGAIANYIMLAQIWLAKLMPSVAFVPLTALMASAAVVNACKFCEAMNSNLGQNLWRGWQDFLGLLGIAMLPQAIWATCSKHHTMVPAYTASVVAVTYLVMARRQQLPGQLQGLWSDIPAWTATLLFMFQPVAQSMSNFSNPSTLEGVSMASLLLGMLGNGLMVPRALFTGDKIWFIGVGWGPLTGWIQLLSLYVAYGVTGVRYLSGFWFSVLTTLLVSISYTVLRLDSQAKGLHSPLQSVQGLFRKQSQPQYIERTM